MNILITGLNGLIGIELSKLINTNLIRLPKIKIFSLIKSEEINTFNLPSYSLANCLIRGNCKLKEDLIKALKISKPDLIIHIAQILYSENILDAINHLKISPHLIIVGTTGVFSKYETCSANYKYSEKLLFDSDLTYNLIRPTMIYGSPYDKNLHKLVINIMRGFPIPILNGGSSLFQPVFYKDISAIIFNLLLDFYESNLTTRTFWNCPGPDKISLRDICKVISLTVGKNVRFLDLPYYPLYLISSTMEFIMKNKSPIKGEQILRLREDKIYNSDMKIALKGKQPTSFESGINYLYSTLVNKNLN